MTLRRARDSTSAADSPAAPPPMITTSYSFMPSRLPAPAQVDNLRCHFWEAGVEWGRGSLDITRRRTGAGRPADQATPVPAGHHADGPRGGDRHLQEHPVPPGDGPATPESGTPAPARAGVPCAPGRTRGSARGWRPADPARAAPGQ